jgi:hypothetical protein
MENWEGTDYRGTSSTGAQTNEEDINVGEFSILYSRFNP